MYYYIYKIICTAGSFKDHYYIGQHKTDNLDDGYKGSGVKIQKYYQKYPNDYKKEILCWCQDEEDMNVKEDFYVGDLYATDPMCLNLRAGGDRPGYSIETRNKMSENNGAKRPEVRKKISESLKGENNPMKRPEVSKKISESLKGRKLSEITRKKMSNKCKGFKWMNNGLQQKKVKPDEIILYLEKGYSFGILKKI